ncbi:carboxypeptidase-like regulatory domain-containing protein [Paractinoplanes atraurantiacus]|uniref:carboxypeptidase-like regulatory domain-containing protein n=1 Tax=Paractinoplanes atraurantiacus TaxID=1036182 RepID=UPI000BE38AC5|nr:carboxypeptidase-like regulatory domain-containing protein [Actinoplanes atraurantiacus]
MTTRSHTRWARAAASIALAGATLAAAATPAAAAPAPINILSVSAENVKPGDKVRVKFRVTNTGSRAETAIVVVGGGLPCATGCRAEPSIKAGKSQDFQATVVAPKAGPGEIIGLNISVAVRLGGQNSYDYKMVYIHGSGASQPKPPSKVEGLSGRVRDSSGKALGGVAVTVRDSAGHEYRTTTDRTGKFSIKSIPEGKLTVIATLNGYRTTRTTVRATASVRLTLTATPTPTTTAPSPRATTAEPEATEPETAASSAAPLALKTVNDEGSGPLPFVLGGLLIAAGLAALALMVTRRRRATVPAGAATVDAPTAVMPTVPPANGYPGPYSRGR